jgi:uncharacterized protein (DUF433 family)
MSTNHDPTWKYLGRKPGSNYQQLFIVGRNIAARTLYSKTFAHEDEDWPGMTPEELAAEYDLPLEVVEEALEYCKGNPPEIVADFEMDEALERAMQCRGNRLSPQEHEEIVRQFRS